MEPIIQAISAGNLEMISLNLKREHLEFRDSEGRNIVHLAAEAGYMRTLKKIIKYSEEEGMTLVDEEDRDKWTPLFYAVTGDTMGFPEIAAFLIKHKAHLNKKDCKGKTPLHYCTSI